MVYSCGFLANHSLGNGLCKPSGYGIGSAHRTNAPRGTDTLAADPSYSFHRTLQVITGKFCITETLTKSHPLIYLSVPKHPNDLVLRFAYSGARWDLLEPRYPDTSEKKGPFVGSGYLMTDSLVLSEWPTGMVLDENKKLYLCQPCSRGG